jgi:hypothetical protein
MQQLVGASSRELTSPLCSLSAVLVAASPPISECRRTKKDLKKKLFWQCSGRVGKKTRVFLKKPSPVVFFGFFEVFWGFLGFFGFFWVFLPRREGFFQFHEYFWVHPDFKL